MCIVFGDGDVDLDPHGPEQFMRAVGGVGDEGDAALMQSDHLAAAAMAN
jgi:hypothetical protein